MRKPRRVRSRNNRPHHRLPDGNGVGRISRDVLGASRGHEGLGMIAVGDVTDAKTLAQVLKYDSVWGILEADV
jgi:glyceraldehyde 3-phosphate dehydrogenase